jgi:hypothetical protein
LSVRLARATDSMTKMLEMLNHSSASPLCGLPHLTNARSSSVNNVFIILHDAVAEHRGRQAPAASPQRHRLLPDAPSFAELGYPRMDIALWYGIVSRGGTPAAIVQRRWRLGVAARLSWQTPSNGSSFVRSCRCCRYAPRWLPFHKQLISERIFDSNEGLLCLDCACFCISSTVFGSG